MKLNLTVVAILALTALAFVPAPAHAIDACFTWSCDCLGYCTFDATCSTGASEYVWTFADGTYGTGQTVVHRYSATGQYNVNLGVNNGYPIGDPGYQYDTVQHLVSVNCSCS